MALRHPELARRPVLWDDTVRMAHREGIHVQVLPLSRPARLVRYGQNRCIQIDRRLDMTARARYAVHELVHVWRDDIGAACYYADEEWLESPAEDFAEMVAWVATFRGPLPG
jgi:hypothetical protein